MLTSWCHKPAKLAGLKTLSTRGGAMSAVYAIQTAVHHTEARTKRYGPFCTFSDTAVTIKLSSDDNAV